MKITDLEIQENNVKSAPDVLRADGEITPRMVKNIFDKLPELIVRKFNEFVDYVSLNFYTKSQTDQAISEMVIQTGAADMNKAVYDTNENGMVDVAENGVFEYIFNNRNISGFGKNGKFLSNANLILDWVNVNDTRYSVKFGDDNKIELRNGNWYFFVLDDVRKLVTFLSGEITMPKRGGDFTGKVRVPWNTRVIDVEVINSKVEEPLGNAAQTQLMVFRRV